MTEQVALDVARDGMFLALALAGPGLLVILVVGIVVSVFQAMTQVHELTLSFIPKAVALGLLLVILGPWMLQTAVTHTVNVFIELPTMVR